MNQAPIMTVTLNPAVDVSCSVERMEPERKLRTDQPRYDPGGGGMNVARAVHLLGGEALAVWAMGGYTGGLLKDLLDGTGVRHHPVRISGQTRQSWTVIERPTSRQYRFSAPGPPMSQQESEAFLEELRRIQPAAGYVVASGALPPEVDEGFYARLAELAVSRGARFVLDTAGPSLQRALDARNVYLVKPNFGELTDLLGRELLGDADLEAAARAIVDEGRSQIVVVSLGARGALVATAEGHFWIAAPTVPIQSRVGAGDSMVAGMVLALARGLPVAEAARFGVAAGTAAAMTPGTALCRKEDADRLFAGM